MFRGGRAAAVATSTQALRACPLTTAPVRPQVEDHPLGLGRRHLHGSMYAGLRTNLPREVMGYECFPFDAEFPGSRDRRQFCSHGEVQR